MVWKLYEASFVKDGIAVDRATMFIREDLKHGFNTITNNKHKLSERSFVTFNEFFCQACVKATFPHLF